MKRLSYIAGIFFLTLLSACRPVVRASHDVIYLKNGEEKVGTLERITVDSVWFATDEGKLALSKDEVQSLDLPQPRPGEQWRDVNDIDDPVLKEIFKNFSPSEELGLMDVNYINLYVEHNFILNNDGTFEKRTRIIRLVTAESGKGEAANNTWTYLADRSNAKVDFARSISPEGIVTHINQAAINRVSLYPTPSEYSNQMQVQIAVPESRVGSLLDFEFSTTQNVIDSIHPLSEELVLDSRVPTLKEIIRIEQPVGGPLICYVSTNESPKKETKQGKEILTWDIGIQPARPFEQMTPASQDYLPRYILAFKKDWYSIGSQLRSSYENATKPGQRIPALVDSLTKGITSDEKKARVLYTFVANQIQNVGPWLDVYSYVPTPAETVLVRRFANNLDRSALLYSLMKQASLDVDIVLVRSRSTGRLIPSFPALGELNCAMVLFEDRIWLDPLPDVAFGTILEHEQDALGLSVTTGKLKKTPLLGADDESAITRIDASLSRDGSLELSTRVELKGQNAYSWKSYLKPLSPAERRQLAEQLATQIHPNAKLRSFDFKGFTDLNANPSYQLQMTIPDYAIRAGSYLIFYLPGVTHSAYYVGATERLYPIDRRTRSRDFLELIFKYPSGDLLEFPKDLSLENDYDSYSARTISDIQGELKFSEDIKVLEPFIPAQAYAGYKSLVEGMARVNQKPLVLKLK